MDRDEKKKRAEEMDRFWDIDALIPPKKAPRYPSDTETTEITLDAPEQLAESHSREIPIPKNTEDAPRRHFIPPHTADEERRPPADEEYMPENALIHRVRLFRWRSNYRYYESFARDAQRLRSVVGVECPHVPFFSYVPQYSQMSRQQLEWYLWWRENLRHGICPESDYSYILLFIYEILNLSQEEDALASRELLCRVWANYRSTYPQLDSCLPEWICDFCLIHRLPPPSLEGKLLSEVMTHCTLKEFYVPSGDSDVYVRALLTFCSNYDYQKSKFCTPERRALYDRAVARCLRAVAEHTSSEGRLFLLAGMDDSRLVRDAYSGALCSYRIKRRIEVEFCSFSRSHELRYLITDMVKYTENRLRAYFGVRSRLSIYALSPALRALLDGVLDEMLPARETAVVKKKREEEQREREYDRLYELPRKELSLSDAAEIERLSWDTTERLVEAFEEEEPACAPTVEEPMPSVSEPSAKELPDGTVGDEGAWKPYRALLCAIRAEDVAGQRAAARAAGVPLEVLADEVNALAADLLGDILLEENGDGYAVIEDYREMLEALTDEG